MANTVREEIIQELMTALQAFSFASVPGASFYRGRLTFNPVSEPPPIITVIPRPESVNPQPYGADNMSMPIDVFCIARMAASDSASSLGEAILGELVQCIYGGISDTWANMIQYTEGGIDDYPDELGEKIVTVFTRFDVEYETPKGNPYMKF